MTMKYLQQNTNPTKLDYTKILAEMILKCNIYPLCHAWESDSKKVLHFHGILVGDYISPQNLQFFRDQYKVSLDVRRLKTRLDLANTKAYLRKQDLNDSEIGQVLWERHIRTSDYDNIFI